MTGDAESGRAETPPDTGAKRSLTGPVKWVIAAVVVGFLGAAGTTLWSMVQSSVMGNEPLAALVEPLADDCTQVVMAEAQVSSLPADRAEFTPDWATENGIAHDARLQSMEVVVQGTSSEEVTIRGFEIIDLEVLPLPEDPVIVATCPPQGGDFADRYLSVRLATQTPGVLSVAWDGGGDVIEFPYKVSSGDTERFVVAVSPEGRPGVYTWGLGLRWWSAGREGLLVLTGDDGRFTTAVPPEQPMRVWNDDGSWDEF